MKLQWLVLIIMILVVAGLALQLFVPQQVGSDGKIRYFGDGPDTISNLSGN